MTVAQSPERLPVTVLTGYLGAGKTTLLNRILSEDHGHRYAVIVNEFGEVGIDADLIVHSDEEVFQMSNGCICCTVRGDLIRTVHELLLRFRTRQDCGFDALVVETTGLADPGPVVQTFFVDPFLQAYTVVDSVITVVDACHIGLRLADSREAVEQVAFADQIVLNKIDLVSPAMLDAVEGRLRALNPFARIHRAERAAVPIGQLIGQGAFDLARITLPGPTPGPWSFSSTPSFSAANASTAGHEHCEDPHCTHEGHAHLPVDHAREHGIHSVSLVCEGPLDAQAVDHWLTQVVSTGGERILRLKGILDLADESSRWVVQGVHMLLDSAAQRPWGDGERRDSRIVFIGRDLDGESLRAGFEACRIAVRGSVPAS